MAPKLKRKEYAAAPTDDGEDVKPSIMIKEESDVGDILMEEDVG